jgi:hypothetical protein
MPSKTPSLWAIYCLASAALLLLLFFGGINSAVLMACFLRLATLIGWMAASVIAIKLLLEPVAPSGRGGPGQTERPA